MRNKSVCYIMTLSGIYSGDVSEFVHNRIIKRFVKNSYSVIYCVLNRLTFFLYADDVSDFVSNRA